MIDTTKMLYCDYDGMPAVTIPGVMGKVYVKGTWKPIDSAELLHSKPIPLAEFKQEFPDAFDALTTDETQERA